MKIGLIDADLLDNGTRHPNLALMKISGFKKEQGHDVHLLLDYKNLYDYDEVYISKVFTFTDVPIKISDYKHIKIGGTGFFEDGGLDLDGGISLKGQIEHHMPDYSLYDEYIDIKVSEGRELKDFHDYKNYSIGFATRGCFRKCDFCVNKKYDKVFRHAPISEFLDESRSGIYLWDDNFLGYPKWEEVLDELEEIGKSFQFRQGLDVRLMTEKKAKRLSKTNYKGDYIFAFDHIEDKKIIQTKLRMWRKYCKKTTKLYVLAGYDSQDEKDIASVFERIKILMRYRCLPYIMRYEDYKNSEYKGMYITIARWCNQPSFFKKKSFRNFCESNQNPDSDFVCASIRYMKDFESKHPEIAKKYFDLWFEDVVRY